MSYDSTDDYNNEDNVLKYIYMLNQHLERLSLLWQGLGKDNKGIKFRIGDAVAPDDWISTQISSLGVILAPHNIVTQLKNDEKVDIILDTYAAFLRGCLNEPYFNWQLFPSTSESFYNTVHLFLNIAENGFGANFTASIQSGISQKIEGNKQQEDIKPYVDLPKFFGFKDKPKTNQPPPKPVEEQYKDEEGYE